MLLGIRHMLLGGELHAFGNPSHAPRILETVTPELGYMLSGNRYMLLRSQLHAFGDPLHALWQPVTCFQDFATCSEDTGNT